MKANERIQEEEQNQSQSVFSVKGETDIALKLSQRLYASYSDAHILIPSEVSYES